MIAGTENVQVAEPVQQTTSVEFIEQQKLASVVEGPEKTRAKILSPESSSETSGSSSNTGVSVFQRTRYGLSILFWLAAWGSISFGLVELLFSSCDKVSEFVEEHFDIEEVRRSGETVVYLMVFTLMTAVFTAFYKLLREDKPATYTWRNISFRAWRTINVPFIGGMAILEIFVVLVWLGLQTFTMYQYFQNYKERVISRGRGWSTERYLMALCRMFGIGFGVNFAILLIPVSKHSFWLELFDMGFERAVRLHRWLGILTMVTVLLHGLFGMFSYIKGSSLIYCMGWSSTEPESSSCSEKLILINIHGQVSLAGGILLSLTSIFAIRRYSYQLFYYSHLIGAAFFIIFGIIHDTQTLTFFFMGFSTYVADKAISMWRRLRSCTVLHYSVNDETECTKLEIALHKSVPLPRQGQWYHINVSQVSALEWHPMSVSECSEENHSITFYIRHSGNWSTRLGEVARKCEELTVRIDGPFGGTHTRCNSYMANDGALFVSGGIGITAHTLAVESALDSGAFKYVGVRWFVTKQAFLDQHIRFLEQLAARGADVVVFITRKPENENLDMEKNAVQPAAQWNHDVSKKPRRFIAFFSSPFAKAFVFVFAAVAMLKAFIWENENSKEFENRHLQRAHMFGRILGISVGGTLAATLGAALLILAARLIVKRFPNLSTQFSSAQQTIRPASQKSFRLKPQEIRILQGRPVIDSVFKEIAGMVKDETETRVIGVSLCGPEKLVRSSTEVGEQLSKEGNVKFIMDEEEFGF